MAPATTGCGLKMNKMKPKTQVIREIKALPMFPGRCIHPAAGAKKGNGKAVVPSASKTTAKSKGAQGSGGAVKRTHSEMKQGSKGDLPSGYTGTEKKMKIQDKNGIIRQKSVPRSDDSKTTSADSAIDDTDDDDKPFKFHGFCFDTLAEFAEWNFRADTKNAVLPPAKKARIVGNLKLQGVEHANYFDCLAPSSDFLSIVKDSASACRGEKAVKETALLTFILVDQTKITNDDEPKRCGAKAWVEAQRDAGLEVDGFIEWKKSPIYAGYRRLLKYFQCCNMGKRAFKAEEAVSILEAARLEVRKKHGKGPKNAK